jgi:medium-chain acyl-[acyl-carrier-protein] hydrolase
MEQTETEAGVYRHTWQVHSYEVDFRKRTTVEAICRRFLDAAWIHAEQLGFGYEQLARQGLLWVLVRLVVRMESCPLWGHKAELSTWPRGTSGAFALRDFEIVDSNARPLAAGASSWLVLDAATHRPQRIDKLLFGVPNLAGRMRTGPEARKLPNLQPGPTAVTTTARYSDIDVNQHVNSARYIGWLMDCYSPEFHRTHTLRLVEVNYVSETKWGDTLSIVSHQPKAAVFSHWIVKPDQSEACRAELQWEPDSPEAAQP